MQRNTGKSRSSFAGITPCNMTHSLRSPRSSSSLTTSDMYSPARGECSECTKLRDNSPDQRLRSTVVVCDLAERRLWKLLSNAECAEDQVQDVVGGCGTRDLVERTKRIIEIQQ